MKKTCLLFFLQTFLVIAYAQGPVDSLISRLQDKNLTILNSQLYQLVDHRLFQSINPDRSTWPDLLTGIASKIVDKSKTFNEPGQIVVSAHLAEVLVRERHVGLGYSLINEALTHVSDVQGLPRAYAYLKYSDIFKHLNRLDSAIFYAERVLDIASEIKSDSVEKEALDQVAMLCYKLKNNSKAELYFKRLVAHPLSTDRQKRDYYNNIGLTFRRRQSYDSAIHYFSKSLDFAIQVKDTAWIGLLNGNIGYIYYLQKKYDEALPGLLKDVDYSFRTKSDNSALNALTTVAIIYITQEKMVQAKIYYDSLARIVAKGVHREVQLEFLKTSAEYFKKKGDLNKSVKFLQSYISLEDSIRDLENVEKASELDAQFDFDRQRKKIERLENQGQRHASQNRQKNYLLFGTFVVIVLASGLIYVLNRSNRFKHETNKLLKEQNSQIRIQADRLNQLNVAKDKLFTIIGHDLRGPINSLKGLMNMVKKEMVTQEEFKHFSAQLQNNVEYVHFTLDNLLHWSRSQLQGLQTRPRNVDLKDITEENINLLSEPATLKNITLRNDVTLDASVYADPDQVRLVLRNLISNAIKFTEPGGHVMVSSYQKNGQQIISVTDNGRGLTEEQREGLFTEHSNTTTLGTDGEKGTGLGLSLCKEMIEKNGGTIWVESMPGEGASFKFTLQRKS